MDSLIEPDDLSSQEELLRAPWGELGRSLTLGVVAGLSKLVLNVFNTLTTENEERFLEHVLHRDPDVGLITVSNHTSTLDDPGLLSAITPLSYFFSEHRHHGVRWSLCAREMCYRNPLLAAFFRSGKTLPVDRGAGLDQLSMRGVGRAVGRGDWLHIFPEGRVVYTGTLGALRWGVGRLVCDAVAASGGRAPVVLPFYHSGMGRVMPYRARLPQVGQRVHVLVGEPVQIEDVACNCNRAGVNQEEVWRELTARIERALLDLQERAPPNEEQPAAVKKHGGRYPKRTPEALPQPA